VRRAIYGTLISKKLVFEKYRVEVTVICRFCQNRPATSNEHIVANSRLKKINAFKDEDGKNDNVRKRFKGITCEECNNKLGTYERLRWSNLAHATIWKILAGNINNVFANFPEYQLKNTTEDTNKFYEAQFLQAVTEDVFFSENTFTFSFDPSTLQLTNKSGRATVPISFRSVDQLGNPIEGAKFYSKDTGGQSEEVGYVTTSDKNGIAAVTVLATVEMLHIFEDELLVSNTSTNESFTKRIDFIVYLSFDFNSRRLLFVLPLIPRRVSQLNHTEIRYRVSHRGFLSILQNHFPEIAIMEISPYFQL
jgi:hypothetical protein